MKNYLFLGAGESAFELISDEKRDANLINIVGILDDQEEKQKNNIKGVPVLGKIKDIKKIVKRFKVSVVVICIERIAKKTLEFIIDSTSGLNIKIKIIPAPKEYISSSLQWDKIRDVSAEDIIGRKNIVLSKNIIEKKINDKTILITGAGGTIGSAICYQLMDYKIKKIVCLCRGENSLYFLKEFIESENKNKLAIKYYLGSAKDEELVREILAKEKVNVIFHAAAHKHVPLMEENEKEAIKNNVFTTLNLLSLSQEFMIENFVFISTDKAVNPKNIMGASKRLGEKLVLYFAENYNIPSTIVRFGNVIGSRGSVVPLFMRQLKKGGPITITNPNVERFFMTIPEAASLVINAAAISNGKDIYMLDMGEAVKIESLVKRLILIHGFQPGKDIKIKYTGLRLGEKLNEELYSKTDKVLTTINPKIFEIKEKGSNPKRIFTSIMNIKSELKGYSSKEVRKWIEKTLKIKLFSM